jgi:apolipoprotein N-acyltransferase
MAARIGIEAGELRTNRAGLVLKAALGVSLAGASALLLTLAFPPYELWPLVWIGFAPMLLAQHRLLPARISSVAPAIAIGGWLGGFMVPIFINVGTYMKWLPLAIGLIVLLSSAGDRRFHERTGYRFFVLHGALVWVGLEMVRSFVPFMGTWAFVGYPLFRQTWLIQPVSIFGIYGLDLLIMLVNYSLGLALLVLYDRPSPVSGESAPKAASLVRWLATMAAILAVWTALSALLLQPVQAPTIRAAALHMDAGRPRGQAGALFVEQTRQAASQGAQLVVWPEMALDYDPQVKNTAELRAVAAETGAYLAIGYFVQTGPDSHRNEATVLSPAGEFLGVFGKDHPVVFMGETGTRLGFYPVYDTEIGRLATIICYDLDFTDTARKVTRSGAQVIAAPSLDGPTLAEQHYTLAVFRAIENRVSIIKSDSSGSDSAIIDPYGRILTSAITPEGGQAVLVANVPLGSGNTLAARLGDWIGWLSLGGLGFFLLFDPLTKAN